MFIKNVSRPVWDPNNPAVLKISNVIQKLLKEPPIFFTPIKVRNIM